MQIECSICCDTLTGNTSEDVRATACGHIFHGLCLNGWISRSNTCPQCRSLIQEKGSTRLYFQVMNNHKSTVERLSEDEIRRGMELKTTVRAAIGSMQKLHDEIEQISLAKTMAKDTKKLAADILKKIAREAYGSSDGEGATQRHLKNTSQKITDALGHIAKFEEKMFIANKSLIDLAKQLNLPSSGSREVQTKISSSTHVNDYLPTEVSKLTF